jgi:hypothetical protein
VLIIGSSQLTRANEFVEVTLPALPIDNTMVVSLDGDNDSTIHVSIADATIRQP